jgi:hypothetical protein
VMRGNAVWRVVVVTVILSCNSGPDTSTGSSSLSGEDDEWVESNASEDNALPASAAGTSSEDGPGVPEDFDGMVTATIPLTPEELQAIAAAQALHAARNPPTKSATDLGFGRKPVAVGSAGAQ